MTWFSDLGISQSASFSKALNNGQEKKGGPMVTVLVGTLETQVQPFLCHGLPFLYDC